MKNILLLVIILFFIIPTISIAQTSVEFAYDNSGNRISRQVIVPGTKSPETTADNPLEKSMVNEMNKQEVKICPTEQTIILPFIFPVVMRKLYMNINWLILQVKF